MTDEDIFFMRVDEPAEVRKQLLESARMSIQTLQRYERFKAMRQQKNESITKLRAAIKDLNQLFVKLRAAMPEATPVDEKELVETVKKDSKDKLREVHRPHQNPDKAIEKLHHQLKAIEHKLNSIT